MIRMPQVDVSQMVNREAQGPSVRTEEQPGRPGDFMAMIQQRIQAEGGEQNRGREPERARDGERTEAADVNGAGRPAAQAQDGPAAESATVRPADQAEGERSSPKKTGEEETAGNVPVIRRKDGTEEVRRDKVKGRTEKPGRNEHAGEAGVSAAAGPGINDAVRVSTQSALKSLRGLGDSAPEMKNLEKTLQVFQEMTVNGGDRSRRPEMLLDLRARMKDALQHLERQETDHEEIEVGPAAAEGRPVGRESPRSSPRTRIQIHGITRFEVECGLLHIPLLRPADGQVAIEGSD